MQKFINSKILKVAPAIFIGILFLAFPTHAHALSLFDGVGDVVADAILAIPGGLSIVLLQILSAVLYLSGVVLNYVVDFTVVNMSDRIADAGVNEVWATLRDIANMGFIFILLFASIKLILGVGSDTQRLIVRVVMIAILINFSLFFTKVVIDASNILAVTFYGAMAPGAIEDGFNRGLANSLMEPLKIQTLSKEIAGFDGTRMIIIGVLGSVFVLIAAFVFFAISLLLLIRFVVLIFILILSPLAFMAMVLPNTSGQAKKWWNALSGQAFFAPVFFLLAWIVIAISGNLYSGDGSLGTAVLGSVSEDGTSIAPKAGDIGLIVNFFVVIAFLIASLVIAKDWANKAGDGVKNMTKWATGAAGNASFGLAGRVGRGTIGRTGQAIADSDFVKSRAPESRAFRLAQAASLKAGSASFDARGASFAKTLDAGKASGKGGYSKQEEEKIKRRAEEAKRYEEKVTYKDVEKLAQSKSAEDREKRDEKIRAAKDLAASDPTSRINSEEAQRQTREANEQYAAEFEAHKKAAEKEAGDKAKEVTRERKEKFAANLSKTRWYTPNFYAGVKTDREAARKIRAGMKEKSDEEKLAELAAKVAKAEADKKAKESSEASPETPEK